MAEIKAKDPWWKNGKRRADAIRGRLTYLSVCTYLGLEVGTFVKSWMQSCEYDIKRAMYFAIGAAAYYFGKRVFDHIVEVKK